MCDADGVCVRVDDVCVCVMMVSMCLCGCEADVVAEREAFK